MVAMKNLLMLACVCAVVANGQPLGNVCTTIISGTLTTNPVQMQDVTLPAGPTDLEIDIPPLCTLMGARADICGDNGEITAYFASLQRIMATEVEKARKVGRKALSTMSFQEQLEKFNVTVAMLSIECRFDTQKSLNKTLEEALQTNEPFDVHSKLLDMYVESSKQQELVSLVELMMRRYRRQPRAYTLCGAACFKLGLVEKARQVMQKAISVLDKKEHVSVLVQFALLESRSGARERGEALFEQVLAVYPARVDVSATYVDMLLKNHDYDHIRQVMERMTSQKLPARKMKILYKKWIEVEERIGDQEQVDKIKQRAMAFIEKAKF